VPFPSVWWFTLVSVHAITAKISPELGSSGLEVLEAETFSLYCFQTQTGTDRGLAANRRVVQ